MVNFGTGRILKVYTGKMAYFCRKTSKTRCKAFVAGLLVVNFLLLVPQLSPTLLPRGQLRVIGYYCQNRGCGGWADRQKGIVSSYVIAAMLRQKFKILMTKPCELSYFLSPAGDKEWRLSPGELSGRDVRYYYYMNINGLDLIKKFMTANDPLREWFNAEYTFMSTNVELVHLLKTHKLAQGIWWLRGKSVPEIYKHVLAELFDLMPGPRMLRQTLTDSLPPGKLLVCAQIRVGGGSDSESFNGMDQLPGLVRFLSPFNTSAHRFFFTSDNALVVRRMQSYFPALTLQIQGPVTHVDRSTGNDVCGGFQRAIVEQLILSTCDVLVISESGLGKISSFLRGSDEALYLFHDGKVDAFMRHQGFPNRLHW